MTEHFITLSTTEPNNNVGIVKLRHADVNSQAIVAQIVENGQPKNFEGLQPYFCLMAQEVTGQGVSEESIVSFDAKKGTLTYTASDNALQFVGRNEAYFSFRRQVGDQWVEQFSTRTFHYIVEKSIYSQPFKDSNYWWTFKELNRIFNQYIADGKNSWEDFVEANREILESIDPGGKILSELLAARNGKPNLKTRIDDLENETTAQLAHNETNLKQKGLNVKTDFGAVGGGEIDDTEAFKKMAAFINTNDDKYSIDIPKDTYIVTEMIDINKPITINYNNSHFVWNGEADSDNTSRRRGIFNFTGKLIGSEISIKAIDLLKPTSSADLLTKAYDGEITLSDNHGLSVGDFIVFKINTGLWDSARLNPIDQKLLKVTSVNGAKITVNYWNPFDFNMYSWVGTVQKCEPLKNIHINGLDIEDIVSIAGSKDLNNQHPERPKFSTVLSFDMCSDVFIDDIQAKHTKLPVIMFFRSHHLVLNHGYLDSPDIVGPGEGYLVQFNTSHLIEVNDYRAEAARHVIDFTNSAFATVDNSYGINPYGADFQLHGQYEHHINYRNCQGKFNGGSGQSFGNANKHIHFYDSRLWMVAGYSDGYIIENSSIRLLTPFTNAKFVRSKIIFNVDGSHVPDSRTSQKERKLVFENSDVELYYNTKTSGGINSLYALIFRGGTLKNHLNDKFLLQPTDVSKIILDGLEKLENISFRIGSNGTDTEFKMHNMDWDSIETSEGLVSTRYTNDCSFKFSFDNVTVKNKANTRAPMFKVPFDDNHSNFKFSVQFTSSDVDNVSLYTGTANVEDVGLFANNFLRNSTIGSAINKFTNINNVAI